MRRRLFGLQLPLVILSLVILGSCLASFAIINFALASHRVNGNYLRVETGYLRMKIPMSWLGTKWEDRGATGGNSYTTVLYPFGKQAVIAFSLYDEDATRAYMEERDLSDSNDMSAVAILEAKTFYDWIVQNNENANLLFTENGTLSVSDCTAKYTIITVTNAFEEDEISYNITGIFVSCINERRIFHVTFHGEEDDWNRTYSDFLAVLGSIEL